MYDAYAMFTFGFFGPQCQIDVFNYICLKLEYDYYYSYMSILILFILQNLSVSSFLYTFTNTISMLNNSKGFQENLIKSTQPSAFPSLFIRNKEKLYRILFNLKVNG